MNKDKLMNVIQIVAKLVIASVIAFFIFTNLDKRFKSKEIDTGLSFKSIPDNTQDIIVLGTSHTEFSFVPEFIYQDMGLYSYVLHSACQPLEVSFEMLKEAYKTQNPKLIVLEVYAALPYHIKCLSDSSYVLPSYQMRGQERINTLNYLSKEKASQYYNDFVINHNSWRTIESINELSKKDETLGIDKINRQFGYRSNYPNLPAENRWKPTTYDEDVQVELEKKDIESLNKILKLCKEHNSELLLYATPWDGIEQKDQSALHKVWDWANDNNVKYVDFIELSKTNGYTMHVHSDTQHAYVNGAGLVTTDLGRFIKNNYEFNHQDNELLTNIFDEDEYDRTTDYLEFEYDPYKYIQRIKAYKGTIVLSYDGHNRQLDEGLEKRLREFGVGDDFKTDSRYVAIFKNGKLLISSYDNLKQEIDGHIIEVNNNEIKLDGNVVNDHGPLSFTLFSKDYTRNLTKRVEYRTDYIWETGFIYYNE